MIDLSHTRAELLAEIEVATPAGDPLSDITDPRVAISDAHVRLCGRGREDLFPLLKLALAERFVAVPWVQLSRDFLMPVKHALGNAYKHGNATDPAKAVSVEIVLTAKGAFIAVTDQGMGFDVARTFRRFQEQENYFQHFGIGFRNLHRARCTVSYENGGRTVLLCFRPTMQDPDHISPCCPASAGDASRERGDNTPSDLPAPGVREPTANPSQEGSRKPAHRWSVPLLGEARGGSVHGQSPSDHAPANILDSEWMRTCLSAELPEFGQGRARLESCRVYANGGRAGGDCGNRYVLRVAGHDGRPAETRILTGRLHATEAAAKADFEAAARLNEAKLSKSLRRPRPVARPAGEPRLVLYDFDPWMNLWEYHTYRGSLKFLRRFAAKTGRALARLHRSEIVFPEEETDAAGEKLQAMAARAETTLQTLPSGPGLVNRFRVCVQRMREQAAFRRQRDLTPIHGALGWDCIHYGVNGKFYLYRFEKCQRSDPAFDLGGFAADLLCFTLASYDEEAYGLCYDAFLSQYNSKAEQPIGEDDLRFYIVLALCERLRRAKPRTKADAEHLLHALDAALSLQGRAAGSAVS